MKRFFAVVLLANFGMVETAHAEVCEATAGMLQGAGAAIAAASVSVQGTLGVAAVEHSSGYFILTSIGAGGTGYFAGTLGGFAATALGVLSSPVVIGAAIGTAVVGTGLGVYCYVSE